MGKMGSKMGTDGTYSAIHLTCLVWFVMIRNFGERETSRLSPISNGTGGHQCGPSCAIEFFCRQCSVGRTSAASLFATNMLRDDRDSLKPRGMGENDEAPKPRVDHCFPNLRVEVMPFPSVTVTVWPAVASESRSIWPLGQRISMVSALSLCARPNVKTSSLAER